MPEASLSKKWRDLKQAGIDPIDCPRRPDILWSHKSHLTKRKELQRERDMLFAKELQLRKKAEVLGSCRHRNIVQTAPVPSGLYAVRIMLN